MSEENMSLTATVPNDGWKTTINDELVLAAGKGDISIVKRLRDGKAAITARCPPPLGKFNNGKSEVMEIYTWGGLRVQPMPGATCITNSAKEFTRTALQAAAEGGHQEIVELLIDAGADINVLPAEYCGRTVFQAAAEGGHQGLVEFLIKHGADVNEKPASEYGRTALQAAAEGGYEDLVELLIAAGADINAEPALDYGRTALQAAAGGGYKDIVKLLMDAKAQLNQEPAKWNGRTALQAAAEGGHQDLVEFLINSGADVNALPGDWGGRTALQAAVESSCEGVVTLLIKSGANINAEPAAKRGGRTVLQAAVGGSYEVVKRLIDSEVDVNEPLAEWNGRTVLQAAAGDGRLNLVELLIAAGGNVNVLPASRGGRTALQAAVENSHEEVVKLLIDSGADINAPPAERGGRTVLQAIVGSSYGVVNVLIDAGVDVNGPLVEWNGKTALQAAAGDGHRELVELLIAAGGNVNTPPVKENGKTVLQAAAERSQEEILRFLIKIGADVHKRNDLGQTILHEACVAGDSKRLDLLLGLKEFNTNAKDYYGSTILHIAAKKGDIALVSKILMEESVDLDIKDNSGKTALQVALDGGFTRIMDDLLDKGANTDGLRANKLLEVLRGAKDNQDTIILCGAPTQKRSLKVTDRSCTSLEKLSHLGPSIYLFSPSEHLDDTQSFVDPRTYLKRLEYPRDGLRGTVVEWAWSPLDNHGGIHSEFIRGIPSNQEILSLKPAKVIVIGYVCFDSFLHDQGTEVAQNEPLTAVEPFRIKNRNVEISWIMRESYGACEEQSNETPDKPGWQFLRSIVYRGTLNLKYLAIPSHAVEFFTLFLDHIHESWRELFEKAKLHLNEMREAQLISGGTDPNVIGCLLKDSQQWSKFRTGLELHLYKSRDILSTFKAHDALYTELMGPDDSDSDRESGEIEASKGYEDYAGEYIEAIREGFDSRKYEEINNGRRGTKKPKKFKRDEGDIGGLKAVKKLSLKIEVFKSECLATIFYLQEETKEMIQLEFNLVSIYEARRSIDMSETSIKMAAASNSMSMSMKRLSWMTFIFLPLTFASGIFGMNVDLLENNPSWLWYLAFVIPLFTLVLLIWILFKYVPIAQWVEDNIGSRLESKKPDQTHTPPSGTPEKPDSSDSAELKLCSSTTTQSISSGVPPRGIFFMNFSNFLRHRQSRHHSDEENIVDGRSGEFEQMKE